VGYVAGACAPAAAAAPTHCCEPILVLLLFSGFMGKYNDLVAHVRLLEGWAKSASHAEGPPTAVPVAATACHDAVAQQSALPANIL